ncbi:MAG: hypothetical protein MUP90_07895 [Gammaproteobacteria bacterium]|nr:hypothetical protein [Gammaproteobacteria bacterium]
MPKSTRPPEFIAHRGAVAAYPENTLPAIAGALRRGLNWVEIDVQFSADQQAIVIHDEDLWRTAGRPGRVWEMHSKELARVSVHEEHRLGPTPTAIPPPLLADAAALLEGFPQAGMFVEIKVEGIRRIGREQAIEVVNKALGHRAPQCVILSFDAGVVEIARKYHGYRIGWVLSHYDAPARKLAAELDPDFLFVNLLKVPFGEVLFEGAWQWAVYEVTSAQEALDWSVRGAELLESFRASDLALEVAGR